MSFKEKFAVDICYQSIGKSAEDFDEIIFIKEAFCLILIIQVNSELPT